MDVIKYWDAIRKHTNDPRDWSMLSSQEQQMVVQSINLMIAVLSNYRG
jgi:hypothetical protein